MTSNSPPNSLRSAEAEAQAKKDLEAEGGGEVVIHDRDNRIRDKDTVGSGKESRAKDTKH